MSDALNDTTKKKILALRKRWKRVVDEAKSENLKTAGLKKDALDGLRADAEAVGVTKSAMNKAMKALDHLDNYEGVRSDIEDEVILDQFDRVMISMELPGFSEAADEAETKQAKKAAPRKMAAKKKAEAKKPESVASEMASDFGYGADNDNPQSESAGVTH